MYKNGVCVYELQSNVGIVADVPYVGMKADYINNTNLGEPDKRVLCKDYNALRPERRSISYYWYDSSGKTIFYAYVYYDKVIDVTDYRK